MTTVSSPIALRRITIAVAVALAVLLTAASTAQADYEQASEHFSEGVQLYRSRGMAVNSSGAGGVEPGSVYVVGITGVVLRFSPGAEGEAPQLREEWGWNVGTNVGTGGELLNEFQRCGPAYAAEPRPPHTFPTCRPLTAFNGGGEQVGHFNELSGVSVDQSTGNVYVLNSPNPGVRKNHLIEVFTAAGVPIGEGFGDWGHNQPFPSESIAEGPGRLHEQAIAEEDSIAVDEDGTVYVVDRDFPNVPGTHEARVMSFEPEQPGNYEHYTYAGQGKDIVISSANNFRKVAMVGSNRLIASTKQQIREYPTGGGSSPICTYETPTGQISAMTTNSETGEVFFFRQGVKSKVVRLGPCNPVSGKFEELQEPVLPTPADEAIYALAVNPDLAWSPQRPQGVFYAADSQVGTAAEEKGIGDIFVPAAAQPPAIESESVANTTSTSSTLQARIDPRGFGVLFQFEYLSEAEYLDNGASFEGPNAPGVTPFPPGQLGGGSVGVALASIANLTPDSEYVFRVIARRQGCAGGPSCETQGVVSSFRTFPGSEPGLPDGRAYELVSPAQKQGGEVFPADFRIRSCLAECKPPGQPYSVFPMQSALDGEAISYMGYPFSPTEGAAVLNSYVSRRTATGWQTTPMSPRQLFIRSNLSYSESLAQGMIFTESGTPLGKEAPAGSENLYLQSAADPARLRPLLTEALFQALSASGRPYRIAGALTLRYGGHSPDFSKQFFEANDSLTFAGAYAPEPPDPGSSGFDLYEWREGELALVNVLPGNAVVANGAAFASVSFSTNSNGVSPDTNVIAAGGQRVYWTASGHLYVREDGRTTREIHHTGAFVTASPDGLQVLLSDGCLYSLTTASCSADLTQGKGGFLGVAGQSEDLSRIYFVDTAAIPGSGQNDHHEEAQTGDPNLYLYEAGAAARFIATLGPRDGAGGSEDLNDWATVPGARTAEASPDGRYLAFGSREQLTGYDNLGPCEYNPDRTAFVLAPCKEAYLYDSKSGRLTCPSCNPTGEAPLGNSTLRRLNGAQANGWLPQPRYLTNRGRLLFDSSDRLSPRDTNGRVEDVYEAEPAGVGSCNSASGCVALISPGTGSVDSNLLAVDENGGNVFFTSREELVQTDTDELIDVYDARVGGGFSAESETQRAECQGESCQPVPQAPNDPTPASSSFQGAGNVKEASKPKPKHRKKHKHRKKAGQQKRAANHDRGGAK